VASAGRTRDRPPGNRASGLRIGVPPAVRVCDAHMGTCIINPIEPKTRSPSPPFACGSSLQMANVKPLIHHRIMGAGNALRVATAKVRHLPRLGLAGAPLGAHLRPTLMRSRAQPHPALHVPLHTHTHTHTTYSGATAARTYVDGLQRPLGRHLSKAVVVLIEQRGCLGEHLERRIAPARCPSAPAPS